MAQKAVEEFHHRLDIGKDELIVKEAEPEFLNSTGAQTAHAFLVRIRTKLGSPVLAKAIDIRVNHMPKETFIIAKYRTGFEKGTADENFTWRVREGKPRLMAYFINSPLLLAE
jgi:hypothetical protein